MGKTQTKWDQYIPQIAGAIRSAVNQTTGFTANMMMLGREVTTPAELMFPCQGDKVKEPNEYVANLKENMQGAHAVAREKIAKSLRTAKRYYDLKLLLRQYEEGDVVYLLDTAVIKGKCRKLQPPWKGPAVITKKLSAYTYKIRLKNAVLTTNHDRMIPCKDREWPQWINNLANGSNKTRKYEIEGNKM